MDKGDFKADILKQEIDLLVRKVNHFDDLRYRTKRMAATLWIAAVGAALTLFHQSPCSGLRWVYRYPSGILMPATMDCRWHSRIVSGQFATLYVMGSLSSPTVANPLLTIFSRLDRAFFLSPTITATRPSTRISSIGRRVRFGTLLHARCSYSMVPLLWFSN